jgi:N-acetyl-anhydromuramyl-L-alanine amidase AmpD
LNDTSIGIEMVNLGDRPFTQAQTEAVAALSKDLMLKYNVKPRNVVGHADIAPGIDFTKLNFGRTLFN